MAKQEKIKLNTLKLFDENFFNRLLSKIEIENFIKFLISIGFEDRSTEQDKKKGKKYFKLGRKVSIIIDELDREIEVYQESVLTEKFKISNGVLIHIPKEQD